MFGTLCVDDLVTQGVGFFLATLFGAKFADKIYANVKSSQTLSGLVTQLNILDRWRLKMGGLGILRCASQLLSLGRSSFQLEYCTQLVPELRSLFTQYSPVGTAGPQRPNYIGSCRSSVPESSGSVSTSLAPRKRERRLTANYRPDVNFVSSIYHRSCSVPATPYYLVFQYNYTWWIRSSTLLAPWEPRACSGAY